MDDQLKSEYLISYAIIIILGKDMIIDYTNKNKIVFLVNDINNPFNISKDPLIMDHKELIEV